MTITPGLAAELTLLTQTLEQPGTDIADTLTRLVAEVRTAVDSYLGLSIAITTAGSPLDLTALEENTRPDDIATSLVIPLPSAAAAGGASASPPTTIALILFAGVPGAFTDLAADLSWITGQPLPEFLLDKHRDPPVGHPGPTPLSTMWTVDQALGVLIGIDLQQAAALVLADLSPLAAELGVS